MKESEEKKRVHSVHIVDGGATHIEGITSVPTFDSNYIEMTLDEGRMKIVGSDLLISGLDLDAGTIDITGKVQMLEYGKSFKQNFMRKIFK